jgi:carbonic anhydrase
VSLVALPLSIGIAIAMGLPAHALLAGVLAAMVGGIITTFIRSGHVSINGPSPALIGIVVSGLVTLGRWEFVLAAFVCAGALQALFGLFKLGGLADFIPSSVVQGMMAAIGVIILAGQVHHGLGVQIAEMNDFQKLMEIPHSLARMNPMIAIIFFNSLIILSVHPYITNRFIKYVPATIWLLLLAVPLYLLFEKITGGNVTILGETHSLMRTADLIHFQMPSGNLTKLFVFPDFSTVASFNFWMVVLSVFLVSTIETLGSAKAIDKIDPLNRKTDLNRDVTAMGLSTMLSGAIGGLPVISVIARSSVNINHGAKTRLSNFVHGALILMFVFLLSSYIQMVPKAALMAILVYTGFKLASPKVFKDAALKGYEQFMILTVTLLATLLTDLNKGILIGMLFTIVIHLVRSHLPADVFFRYLAFPSFNLAKIEDHYHLRVKGVANFIGILKIRKVLSNLPGNERIVFDFSHTRLVDFSFLEFVNNWGKDYMSDHQGTFEIVGLDEHLTTSEHPYSIHTLAKTVAKPLSKRQKELKEFAFANHWNFDNKIDWNTDYLKENTFFKTRPIEYVKNRISGNYTESVRWELIDITFDEGALMAAEVHNTTMLRVCFDQDLPDFELEQEKLFSRLLDYAIKEDASFGTDTEFGNKFSVKGANKKAIQGFFTDELQHFIMANNKYHIESTNNQLLVFRYFRLMSIGEIEELISFGDRLRIEFQRCLAMPK